MKTTSAEKILNRKPETNPSLVKNQIRNPIPANEPNERSEPMKKLTEISILVKRLCAESILMKTQSDKSILVKKPGNAPIFMNDHSNSLLMKRPGGYFTTAIIFLLALSLIIILSCNKTTSVNATGYAHFEVRLTDAPASYDAVYIDVKQVEVNVSADTGASNGWQPVPLIRPGVYNLLDFRNGIDTILAAGDFPAGTLSQMRLILGDNNSVVVGGQTYPLKTPSGQQSGVKFNIHASLTPGIEYRLWIDFDASKSIVTTGKGTYNLKPVIRTFSEAIGGSIKGYVLPTAAKPEIWAINGSDTLLGLPDSTTGYYFFGGVAAGSWNLVFHAQDTTYADTTANITVSTGVVTDADTVWMRQR